MKFDTTRCGRIDKRTFANMIKQMSLNLADDATELLF